MTLSLSPSPDASTPAGSADEPDRPGSPTAAPAAQPAAGQPPGDDSDLQTIDLASSPASTLGLNDNLLLAGLVAVFALAVIGLVSAGGHRGTWRRH